jgi:hypothetical protein
MFGGIMRVFIANFGRENFAWPQCLDRHEIATVQDERVHDFWHKGDRLGYIDFCIENLKTLKGIAPTRPVAGRWFNLGTIITTSTDDMWLHQDGKYLWWTITTDAPAIITLGHDTKPSLAGAPNVYFYRKPALPWSNRNKLGQHLNWQGIHPKAPDFLITEATLQQLGEDYAGYAISLIEGKNLKSWHERTDWKGKTQTGSRRNPSTSYNSKQLTFSNMANNAWDTSRSSNGQQALRTIKNKNFMFMDRSDLERYIRDLFDSQEGLCALTGLSLQFLDGDDSSLICSLDRIDSQSHYERGNLQIVCRFVNSWKSDTEDNEFRRLIAKVQNSDPLQLKL